MAASSARARNESLLIVFAPLDREKNYTSERGTKSELNRLFAQILRRGRFSLIGVVHRFRFGGQAAVKPISEAFTATPNPLFSAAALSEPPQTWRTLTQRQRLTQQSRQPPRATHSRTHAHARRRGAATLRAHLAHASREMFPNVCVRVYS